jgi:membrane protein
MKFLKKAVSADPGDDKRAPRLSRPSWLETLAQLRDRFVEDRLAVTAGSLTFMTLIALVPLLAVMLAVFTAFPVFSSFQGAVEKLLLQNLVPDNVARPVMAALNRFAGNATKIGALGLAVLGVSALALLMTIDRTLNALWRVRRPRPYAQRLLVYWAALTLGPLFLGASLTLTSYVLSASRGLVSAVPGGLELTFDVAQFLLLALAATGLFRFVPNTQVRWLHAWAGGLFVAVGIEVAKRGLVWYVGSVPTFNSVYGAFAIVPILLLWIYLLWVVVLLGAVIAAYAPTLGRRLQPRLDGAGDRFDLALGALSLLEAARHTPAHGATVEALAGQLRCDRLDLEPLVEMFEALGWVARLDEGGPARCVLLADPAITPAVPLIDRLLLAPSPRVQAFRQGARFDALKLSDLLG